MERNATLLGAVFVLLSTANAQLPFPPDRYGEQCKGSIGYFENQDQLVDENGNPRPDIFFTSVGCVPKAALGKQSKVSFLTYEHGATPADPVQVTQITMQPWGDKARKVEPQGIATKDWYQNFYLPQTAPAGASQVTGFERVIYPEVFKKTDMQFYSGSGGQKMAFVMWPGSHPEELRLLFTGQDSLKVDLFGNLKVFYDGRFYVLPEAVAYQVATDNSIIPIGWNAGYQLVGNGGVVEFGFSSYNPDLPLIFQVGAMPAGGPDPLENLCWSSYLGGTNRDFVTSSVLDADGNFFLTGATASDFNTIPDNPGTTTINGGQVVLVARFHDNYHLDWLTYYGATAGGQGATAIAVREGPPERIYVGGSTYGNNLYTFTEAGAYNLQSVSSGNYSRAFIAKFDLAGALYWSTYFGNGESEISGMDVDAGGRLHITGYSNDQGLPVTPLAGATSWPFTGTATNTIIARFTLADTVNWCTPYNGEVNAEVTGAIGDIKCFAGGFYVSSLASATSPTINAGGVAYYDSTNGGGLDCLFMKFDTAAHCDHATMFGGNGDDKPGTNSLTVTSGGDVYFLGTSASSSGFPLMDDGSSIDTSNIGLDGFIAMFRQGDLALVWSTFVNATLFASCLDDQGQVFAVGTSIYSSPASFPLINYAPYYNQPTYYGEGDGVIIGYHKGDNGAHEQYFGTYFGGGSGVEDNHDNIYTTQWKEGRLYIAGITAKGEEVNSFFPLVNPGLPAYFDGTYQYVPNQFGINQNLTDAFVASICTGIVGIEELAGWTNSTFGIGALEGDGRILFGLPDGRVQLHVFDATGRLVSSEAVLSVAGRAYMHAQEQPDGLYLVQAVADGYPGTARFVSSR